ncbi:hypothetical protein D9M70_528490 [compost metagenome]
MVILGIELDALGHDALVFELERGFPGREAEERHLCRGHVAGEEVLARAAHQAGEGEAAHVLAAQGDILDDEVLVRLIPGQFDVGREHQLVEAQLAQRREAFLLRVGQNRHAKIAIADAHIRRDAVVQLGQGQLVVVERETDALRNGRHGRLLGRRFGHRIVLGIAGDLCLG